MYTEDELLPLSGLQHLLFCQRQRALIHVEGVWRENALTVEGQYLHRKVDQSASGEIAGVRTVRGLALRSLELGLAGRADVVEFRRGTAGAPQTFPVEFKRGQRRRWLHDEIQLCAQAMALEEMLNVRVSNGALFYGKSRRRLDVQFHERLREETRRAARHYHELVEQGVTPVATQQKKCRSCSLLDAYQPKATSARGASTRYLERLMLGGEDGR